MNMLNQEQKIIKDTFEKAIKNGYPKQSNFDFWDWESVLEEGIWGEILTHEFALALWGKEKINFGIPNHSVCIHILPAYLYHLL